MTGSRQRARGFSLLELLVAFSIMAMSLALLYRVTGGSASTIGDAERYSGALILAESLLASHETVPAEGWHEDGSAAGYRWSARSAELPPPASASAAVAIHRVSISIAWAGAERERRLDLITALPVARESGATP